MRFFKNIPKGVDLFLVGGAVRDMLLNQEPNDLDFCVQGIEFHQFPELLEQLGCQPLPQGKVFEFVLNEELKTAKAKHPEHGVLDFKLVQDIESDLIQRDFTVNAIAINVQTNEHIDPCMGKFHLQDMTLVPCSNQCFLHSPERVLRAVRFASRGFVISSHLHVLADQPELIKAIKNACASSLSQQADKMFRADAVVAMQFFANHPELANALFNQKLRVRTV